MGYKYMSVKDNLKWSGLSRKHYTHIIMGVGRFTAMSDEDFKKASLANDEMKQSDIANLLISAFGDGK